MMAKKKREAAGGMNNIKRRVVILIAVAAMAVCSLVVVRGVLLANAQRMATAVGTIGGMPNRSPAAILWKIRGIL